jgi:hypothetical protein
LHFPRGGLFPTAPHLKVRIRHFQLTTRRIHGYGTLLATGGGGNDRCAQADERHLVRGDASAQVGSCRVGPTDSPHVATRSRAPTQIANAAVFFTRSGPHH